MKYIYVLEDDSKLQRQLLESLQKSEPQAQIRFFNSLEAFQLWLAIAVKEGQKSLYQGGAKLEGDTNQTAMSWDPTDELLLLITKEEWLGSRYLHLIKKTIESFIRKNICTKEDPTRVVITAYEGPDFDFKLVEDPIINNVLFKPFDDLILSQLMHFAIKGHHVPSQSFVHKVQTTQEVEMTKEVHMEAVGDIGFVTKSPREIKTHQISKYYGDVFKSKGRTHVMGRCIACEPHPELPGEFRVWFSFFGIPSWQISDIRKNMVMRNEVEYSGDTPFDSQTMKLDWVILDSDKERVVKFKKILTNVADAQVRVFTNFETFYFQSDPHGTEGKRKEAPWKDTDKLTLHLNVRGENILRVLPQDQEKKKIFGEPFAEFKKSSFHSKLHEASVATLKSWIAAGVADQELLVVHNQGHFYTMKAVSFEKKTIEKETFIELVLTEPSPAERTKWVTAKFPTPQSAHAILISEEFLYEERLGFWEEFAKNASVNGPGPRFFALYKQVPDEKLVRRFGWLEDIYENGNDAPYIERKLNWRASNTLVPKEAGSSAYLRKCKESVRVANPVSIAELSEASLTMNYSRAIKVGAFRKFVLSKTAETFNEYRATCNYAVEHPTEKGQFQIHFVFFGLTDGHLKSIRVWILDNYVQSKQEENT
jgi:hypothetical protein